MSAPFVNQTTAARVNASYQKQPSNYVTLSARLMSSLALGDNQQKLNRACEIFRSKWGSIKKWSDLNLCKAQKISMDSIVIDSTLQRDLDITWVSNILKEFAPTRADAIRVYTDKNQLLDTTTCWDGQHTLIALYVIATIILKLDPRTISVPIVINPSTQKDQMRENFMSHNGYGKKPVSNSEKHRQMVLGVRIDNSLQPNWLAHDRIQTQLENHGMFVCDESSDDVDDPGAVSNLSEILETVEGTNKRTEQDYINFCKYFQAVCMSSRRVDSSEQWQILDYFRLARLCHIPVDDHYIKDLADTLNEIFTPSLYKGSWLVNKAKKCYQEWYRENQSMDGTLHNNNWAAKKKELHLVYLIHLINKHNQQKFEVPALSYKSMYVPSKYYLTQTYCQSRSAEDLPARQDG